ncbi:DODA-type extradiol aromatic ring-opening family dioxygenase [Marinomonas pollencensis]|uniref:4,5-DOPA dioxygenase extradiol n=1 Tax=Marinomonas pollencensis TaxID=491954 RepID=A0A3E0DG05_9GAMM|nr:class III extradiol ring-cleavage dioxygenase [Marinomonas pollencensis]REG81601.1 4,5-DOPA dioxygenase extradiol [Marinomonas pollencensis]
MNRQPTLFISHGSPMMAAEISSTSIFLSQLGKELSRPKAIIVFSAHFDMAADIVITSGEQPETIHDFYGFPKSFYEIQYNAPGDPALAKKIAQLFENSGLHPVLDENQGWDHGVWIPLRLMYPNADVPIVQISINSGLGASRNHLYGKLISSLKDDNILIIGSGGISHNLKELFSRTPTKNRVEMVSSFTDWVHDKLIHKDLDALLNYQQEAPYASFNHPSQEHFLPLISALGSSDLLTVERLHKDVERDILSLDSYLFS